MPPNGEPAMTESTVAADNGHPADIRLTGGRIFYRDPQQDPERERGAVSRGSIAYPSGTRRRRKGSAPADHATITARRRCLPTAPLQRPSPFSFASIRISAFKRCHRRREVIPRLYNWASQMSGSGPHHQGRGRPQNNLLNRVRRYTLVTTEVFVSHDS